MIYITGDTHGDINRFNEANMHGESTWTKDDYLIICGDFGFIFDNDDVEKAWLDELENKPFTVLWLDGNHENFNAISEYPVVTWNGGKVHRIRKNILHLMRGQVFTIDEKTFFTMGGAYSIDRYMRQKDVSYWEQELPNAEEYKEAYQNLLRHNKRVDYIITHTAPREIIRRMGYYPNVHDMELTGFLEWVMYECDFKHWYFGHWHENKAIGDKYAAIYTDVVEII